jgi:hypothetical protein
MHLAKLRSLDLSYNRCSLNPRLGSNKEEEEVLESFRVLGALITWRGVGVQGLGFRIQSSGFRVILFVTLSVLKGADHLKSHPALVV